MSISLLKQTTTIYKPLIAWNVLVSFLTSYIFILKGFHIAEIYRLAMFLKLLGWTVTIGIYYLFYTDTSYYFKNQGISFKTILINLIKYDALAFILILILIFLCRA